MFHLKGFVTIHSLVDNNKDITAPLGELSAVGRTFDKDVHEYVDGRYPDFMLSVLRAEDTSGVVAPDTLDLNLIFDVINELKLFSATNDANNPGALKTVVVGALNGKISNLDVGSMVFSTITMPGRVSFQIVNNTTPKTVTLWFSSAVLDNEYDKAEIVVIPPISNLDNFFLSPSQVKDLNSVRNEKEYTDQIRVAKEGIPESDVYVEEVEYNPNGLNVNNFMTYWTCVIHGNIRNPRQIKDTIIEYILDNSTHTRDEWATIFPGLFEYSEVMMYPMWDKIAVPNLGTHRAIQSAIMNIAEGMAYVKSKLSTYTTQHINNNTETLYHTYKHVTIFAVSSKNNREEAKSIFGMYKDYVPAATDDPEFSRMSQRTSEFYIALENLLYHADNYSTQTLPSNVYSVVKSNVEYVAGEINNVTYFVMRRY